MAYQLLFGSLLALAPAHASAQTREQPGMQSQSIDRISFSYGGMRTATLLSWNIGANGQGEVKAQMPLGWAVGNTDLGIGDYRFVQGVHRFDIGSAGYQAVRAALPDVLSGRAQTIVHKGGGLECATGDLGSRILAWSTGGSNQMLQLQHRPDVCVTDDDKMIGHQLEAARRVIARHMLRQGHPAVSETIPDMKPAAREPLTQWKSKT